MLIRIIRELILEYVEAVTAVPAGCGTNRALQAAARQLTAARPHAKEGRSKAKQIPEAEPLSLTELRVTDRGLKKLDPLRLRDLAKFNRRV